MGLKKFLLTIFLSVTLVAMPGAHAYNEEKIALIDKIEKNAEGIEMVDSNSVTTNHIDSPKKQIERGVPPEAVKCNSGLKLIFKASDNKPACVKITSVDKLVQRGWAVTQDWQYHD